MKKLFWILILLGLVAGGTYYLSHRQSGSEEEGGNHRGMGPTGPVPVVASEVKKQDVPIFLDGIGTVQAFNSVTVRARIDGQVDKIVFTEGQDVKAGDLLAVIDPRPFETQLAQAEAKARQDEAQLANAQSILARNLDLQKKGVLDQQTFDTSKFQVQQLQATLQADQAAVANARVQVDYTRITSPIDGRAGVRQVDQGNIVHANDNNGIVVITQLHPISVVFTLPESNLQPVLEKSREGSALKVRVMDRGNTKVLDEGELTVVDNQIDQTTGTVKLKATFNNENLQLWPGQFVNARLLLSTQKDGIVVSSSAVQRGPNGTYVYVIGSDQTVEMRPITVAQTENNLALISEGLAAGEQVVVDGQYKLQPKAKVEVVGTPGKPHKAPAESAAR